jgi:hypothetical protein
MNSTAGTTAGVILRIDSITLTSFRIVALQADAARAPSGGGTAGQIPQAFTASIHWVVYGYPPAGT